MMRKPSLPVVLQAASAALILLAGPIWLGCGGGGGASATAPPPAQATMQMWVTPDSADFNKAILNWTLPAASNGVQIEFQLDGGGYQSLMALPMGVDEVAVLFDPTTPELHTFGFRVTALNGGKSIAQAEASHRRSLRPVLGLSSVPKPESGAMGIYWGKDPISVASGFALERQATSGTWTPVTLGAQAYPGPGFSAWDLDAVPEGEATYRVVPTLGGERGMPLTLKTRMPLLAPDQLAATPASTGWNLSWVNRSGLATVLGVYRSTFGPADATWTTPVLLGQVVAATTSYLDLTAPTSGRIAYQVVALLPGTGQTESSWCVAGGPSSLSDLGLSRNQVVLPFSPQVRDLDGAWMGFKQTDDPAIPPRLARNPVAPGFPLAIPSLVGGLYTSWGVSASMAPNGVLDLQVVESGSPSFGPLAVQGFRWSSGAWKSRSFTRNAGLAMGPGGFLGDGTILAFTVDSTWQRGVFHLAMDGVAAVDPDPFSGLTPKYLSGPFGTPGGEGLSLVHGGSGWILAIRSPAGLWRLQSIPELDPMIFAEYSCRQVVVDAIGTLHALFAAPITNGYRYDYLRIRAGGTAEFQALGTTQGATWGLVGGLAVTPDGQKVGFALLDDSGMLRTGIRTGAGAWSLKSGPVPDALADGKVPFLLCGFRTDGRFWVLHDEVIHPFRVRSECYFELLEEP